jgi:hypothetical protein
MSAVDHPVPSPAVRRTGGVLALVGALLVSGFRLAHGDLPAADAPAALSFIHAHPLYAGVHVGAVIGVLISVAGLVLVAATVRTERARVLSGLAVASLLVGTAVYTVEHIADGITGQGLAGDWYAAVPAERGTTELSAGILFAILRGPSLAGIVLLWGLPVLLMALAVRADGGPRLLGAAGAAVGAPTVVGAVILLFAPDLFPGVLVYGVLATVLVQAWIASTGVWMLRTARAGSTLSA